MRRHLGVVVTALAATVLLGACGGDLDPEVAAQKEAERQTQITRQTLSAAVEAAQRYGQAHLGHFANLRLRDLRREGFLADEGVELKLESGHSGYCIRAENPELPSIHPWAKASVSSGARTPTATDRCKL